MKKMFLSLLVWLAFWLLCACNINDSKSNRVNLNVDTVLLSMHRVQIQHLDAQGNPTTWFDDSLKSLQQLVNLAAPGYAGGPTTFSIKGYKGNILVYDIVLNYNGSATTNIQKNKIPATYTLTAQILNTVDHDGDMYNGKFDVRTDVNTNLDQDSVSLKYFYQVQGRTQWLDGGSAPLFRIAGNSALDAHTDNYNGDSHAIVNLKIEVHNQLDSILAQLILSGIREETLDEDDLGFHFKLINHTGAYLTTTVYAGSNTYVPSISPADSFMLDLKSRPTRLIFAAAASGNIVTWKDTIVLGQPATYSSTLISNSSYFILLARNRSATPVNKIVLDSGLTDQQTLAWSLPADSVQYNFGMYHAYSNANVYFKNITTGSYWSFDTLIYLTDPKYGFKYVDLGLDP